MKRKKKMKQKYEGLVLVTDVDNTLVRGVSLSDENAAAIKYFVENGGQFTVATGRTAKYIADKFFPVLTVNAPIISVNGTVVADENTLEPIFKVPLQMNFKNVIKSVCEAFKLDRASVYTLSDTPPCGKSFEPDENEEYYKILFVAENEDDALAIMTYIENRFAHDFCVMRSWNTGVEVIPQGSGKGACLRKLRELLGNKKIIAMGDYENDITLFNAADISIAVENAVDGLKKIADFVTVSCDENAVSYVINHIDEFVK